MVYRDYIKRINSAVSGVLLRVFGLLRVYLFIGLSSVKNPKRICAETPAKRRSPLFPANKQGISVFYRNAVIN